MAISRFKTSTLAQGLPKYTEIWDQTSVVYTTAGTTWVARTLPSSGSWWSPVLGGASNNVWMTARGTAAAISTDNGTTWTARTKNLGGSVLAYGAGKWVSALYTGNTSCVEYSSDDGATWTTGTMPAANNWDSIIFADGRFFAVSYGTNDCATSTNGTSWSSVTMPSQTNARRTSVTYSTGLDMWITTSRDSSHFDSSPDGVTWTARTASSSADWYGSASNSSIFVAIVNNSTTYATSTNGTSWTGRTFAVATGSVAGSEGMFGTMVVPTASASSTVYTSTNGTTWTARTMPSSASWLTPSKNLVATSNVLMIPIYGGSTIAVSLY